MSVPSIDPIASAIATQNSASVNAPTTRPASKAAPAASGGASAHAARPAPPAPAGPAPKAAPAPRIAPPPAASPAATVQVTQIPASVPADDRATYLQLLKANLRNVNAALAALHAMEANEKNG